MRVHAIVVAVGTTIFGSLPALADAERDTRELWEVLQVASTEAIASLKLMETDPIAAAEILEKKVKRPVETAQGRWWDAMTGSEDQKPYLIRLACFNAANSLVEIASDLAPFLQGKGGRPDVSLDVDYFHDYLGECETAVGNADGS